MTTATTRERAIRILARPSSRLTLRQGNARVGKALKATTWGPALAHRCSFLEGAQGRAADDLLIEIDVSDRPGSPRYAKRANELVQRLYDTDTFTRVGRNSCSEEPVS